MTRWSGIVLALASTASERMASRLVAYLHPVAGRPLVWHSVSSLATLDPPPERIVVVSGVDLAPELFQDVPVPVTVLPLRETELAHLADHLPPSGAERMLVVDAATLASPSALEALRASEPGAWLPAEEPGEAAAAWVAAARLPQLFRLSDPLRPPNGVLADQRRVHLPEDGSTIVVRDRAGLSRVSQRVRDRLVRTLMDAGVTFLLPDTVMVDVDVRIGRDSIIYPGVVLEGGTTIGEETVIGPGCRVIDSWVGSGVELRGWNYISHTSVRNRAILEPYVRRGFD